LKENGPTYESWRPDIESHYPPTHTIHHSSMESTLPSDLETAHKTSFVSNTSEQALSGSQSPLPSGKESVGQVSSTEGETETETIERVVVASVSGPTKSAKKLARMGYPVDVSAVVRSSPTPSTSKRFGAIKSFVQTIRGKT
jgi:hypothetical protein